MSQSQISVHRYSEDQNNQGNDAMQQFFVSGGEFPIEVQERKQVSTFNSSLANNE